MKFAYNIETGENEDLQLEYNKGYWRDIVLNSSKYYSSDKGGVGNSLGGMIFDWLDRWFMDGTPYVHNRSNNPAVYSPDGLRHEEYFGIMSMGDGSDWLMRQKRKAYDYFKKVWNRDKLSF